MDLYYRKHSKNKDALLLTNESDEKESPKGSFVLTASESPVFKTQMFFFSCGSRFGS